MRDKLLKIQKLVAELLDDSEVTNTTMTRAEFKLHLGDKANATQLAKECGVGHSVFLSIIAGEKHHVMRQGTKDRILSGLKIRVI